MSRQHCRLDARYVTERLESRSERRVWGPAHRGPPLSRGAKQGIDQREIRVGATRGRKAQVEMIGLVFVVVLIVLGLLLYARLGGSGPDLGATSRESQAATSFLLALKETTVPECRTSVERVARACIEHESICGRDACLALQDTFDMITSHTLTPQGWTYNLTLEGTDVMVEQDCPADSTRRGPSPRVPVVLSGGQTYGYVRLNVCR